MPFLDYELPPHLIAQQPAPERDQARLLVVRRADQTLEHRRFFELPELLTPGDLLVLNDTRVLPARLLGRRESTGGRWEGLFLQVAVDGTWELLCQTRGRMTVGEAVQVEPGPLRLILTERDSGRPWRFRPEPMGAPADLLPQFGQMPLPHYIRKGHAEAADAARYQTVYAKTPGAVAAPTAGLHFTDRVFARLAEREIHTAFVTLHVGLGTFKPLKEGDEQRETLHQEWCELPASTAEAIQKCRARGGRVVAVGTTTVRTLESAARYGNGPWSGPTDLFIRPPYTFQFIDAMVTNFHLPRTSLLLLVGALAGDELLRRAYAEAVKEEYRFYSYGDAMLVV